MLDIRKIAELPEAHKRDCGKPTGIGGAANRHGKERHMQITGGWVYDPDEGFAERTVCTDGEKIARISTDTKRLDAAGCYVLPLLIDLHIHGYAGADAGSADPAELERMARGLLPHHDDVAGGPFGGGMPLHSCVLQRAAPRRTGGGDLSGRAVPGAGAAGFP